MLQEEQYPKREAWHALVKRQQLYFHCVFLCLKAGCVMASQERRRGREGKKESEDARSRQDRG